GIQEGSANGSSKCQIISGMLATYSSGVMMRDMFSMSKYFADSLARETSEYPSLAKPTDNVLMSGLNVLAIAAINVESMPPDNNTPTFLLRCIRVSTCSDITS